MNIYKESLDRVYKNKSKVALVVIIEFLFLMLIFISGTFFYNKIIDNYEIIQGLTYDFAQEGFLDDTNAVQGKLLLLNSALNDITKNIVFFSIILIIGTTIIIGYTSSLLNKIIYNGEIDFKYFLKFFLLTLLFSLIFVGLFIKMNFLLNTSKGSYLFWGVMLMVNYFASVCFALFLKDFNLKKALKGVYSIAIKKFSKIFLYYLSGIGLFLLFGYFLTFVSNIYDIFSIIGSLILILAFVWFRILMIEVCGRQDSNLRKH